MTGKNLYTIYKNGIIIKRTRHGIWANLLFEYYMLRYSKNNIVSFDVITDVDTLYPGKYEDIK